MFYQHFHLEISGRLQSTVLCTETDLLETIRLMDDSSGYTALARNFIILFSEDLQKNASSNGKSRPKAREVIKTKGAAVRGQGRIIIIKDCCQGKDKRSCIKDKKENPAVISDRDGGKILHSKSEGKEKFNQRRCNKKLKITSRLSPHKSRAEVVLKQQGKPTTVPRSQDTANVKKNSLAKSAQKGKEERLPIQDEEPVAHTLPRQLQSVTDEYEAKHRFSVVQENDAVDDVKQKLKIPGVLKPQVNIHIENKAETDCKPSELKAHDAPDNRDDASLMDDLLSNRHFRIRPQELIVYMLASRVPRPHPKAVGDMPWSWLREEKWRAHTFVNYPHNTAKSAFLLAEEGFVYIGSGKSNDDTVICVFCCITKQGWQFSDVIRDVHRELSPNCPMVTGVKCNNVPMSTPAGGTVLFSDLVSQNRERHRKGSHGRGGDEIETNPMPDNRPVSEARHRPGPSSNQMAVESNGRGNDVIESDAAPEPHQVAEAKPMPERDSSRIRKPAVQLAHSTLMGSSAPLRQAASTTVTSVGQPSQIEASSRTSTTAQQANRSNNLATTTQAESQGTQHIPAASPQAPSPATSSNPPTTQITRESTSTSSSPSNVATASSSPGTPTAPSSSTTNQTSNTQAEQGSTSQDSSQTSQGTSRPPGRGPTYGDLGIITERPKRYEYAVRARRLDTFEHWPRDHHLKKEDLSSAGFYYAGYGDCARCFYCGGGLRNWEDDDDVWVEHARWFPKCAFIRQQMGQAFVDTVQDLNKDHDQISYKMVTDTMGARAVSFQLDSNNVPLKRDPAVRTIIDMGFYEKDVLEAAVFVKEQNTILSADKLFEKLEADGKRRIQKPPVADSVAVSASEDFSKDKETMKTLKEQNSQLRQQTVCKICMDKEVAVVFLPCGHLVSCTDCASAMKDCPVCRNHVKGIVRAFMS